MKSYLTFAHFPQKLKSGGLGKVLNMYKLEQTLKRASDEDSLLPCFPFLVQEA